MSKYLQLLVDLCKVFRQYHKIQGTYLHTLYDAILKHFLSVIQHLKYNPSMHSTDSKFKTKSNSDVNHGIIRFQYDPSYLTVS